MASPQSAVCFFFWPSIFGRRRHPSSTSSEKLQKEIQKKKRKIIHSLPETTQRQARATHGPANTDENFARQICPSEIFAQSRARRREKRERERGRVFAKEVKSRYRQKNVVSNFSLTPPLPALSRPLPGRKDGKPIGKNRAAFRALREARRARKTKRGARWVGRIDLAYFTSVFGVVFGSKDRFRSAFSKRAISHFLSNQLPPSNFYRVVLVQSLKK